MEISNNYEQNEMQVQKPHGNFKQLRTKHTAGTKTTRNLQTTTINMKCNEKNRIKKQNH